MHAIMKKLSLILAAAVLCAACMGGSAPELERKYDQFSLGSIKPEGCLLETLQRQRDGLMPLAYILEDEGAGGVICVRAGARSPA